VSDVGSAVKSERPEFCSGNRVGAENVFAGFQVKPEIGIAHRSRREEKCINEDVDLKDLEQQLIHQEGGGQTEGSISNSATPEVTEIKITLAILRSQTHRLCTRRTAA